MPYQQTITTIAQTLTEVFSTLNTYFDLQAALRTYKPLDGGWSIDEILEHITLTNHFLMLTLRSGCEKALKRAQTQPVVEGESDLEKIVRISDPDAFPWVRPEHMEPKRTQPMSEIRLLMRRQGEECLEILNKMNSGEGSLHQVRMSVQNLGKLDLYQWLYFLTQHAQRHITQIGRIHAEYESAINAT
jgi:hypothetical protein